MKAYTIYKIGNYFFRNKFIFVSKLFTYLNYILHNSYIPSSCSIGSKTIFAYRGIGIVIHSRSIIGNECMIGQGITIGGKGGESVVPIIEDNVYISAGSRIIGNIRIGHNSIIAPNSVVMKDVEPYSIVGGIPSRVLSKITKESHNTKYKYYYGQNSYLKSEK